MREIYIFARFARFQNKAIYDLVNSIWNDFMVLKRYGWPKVHPLVLSDNQFDDLDRTNFRFIDKIHHVKYRKLTSKYAPHQARKMMELGFCKKEVIQRGSIEEEWTAGKDDYTLGMYLNKKVVHFLVFVYFNYEIIIREPSKSQPSFRQLTTFRKLGWPLDS